MHVFGTDNFLPLTFYLTAPYRLPVTDTRFSMYGFNGTPSVMFDGTTASVGGLGSGSMYANYLPIYQARAATPSPLVIESSYTILGDQATVTATLTVDQALPAGTRQVQFYVALADLHDHDYMVMASLAPQTLTVSGIGQQQTVERTFTVAAGWEHANLRIVILVQDLRQRGGAAGGPVGPRLQGQHRDRLRARRRRCRLDPERALRRAGRRQRRPQPGRLLRRRVQPAVGGRRLLDRSRARDQVQTVAEDGQLVFSGQYTDGPLAGRGRRCPAGRPIRPRGVSIVDWDGDGDLDLHVLNEGAADNLLRNDGGVFTDVGSGPILDTGAGCSSAWADYNGDGNLDVYIGRNGQANLLLTGDGSGGFAPGQRLRRRPRRPGPHRGLGRLRPRRHPRPLRGQHRRPPTSCSRASGDLGGGFYIFSTQSNGAADPGNGRGMAWADIDFDGRLDVYVVNSFAANVLMQNTPQGFNDISAVRRRRQRQRRGRRLGRPRQRRRLRPLPGQRRHGRPPVPGRRLRLLQPGARRQPGRPRPRPRRGLGRPGQRHPPGPVRGPLRRARPDADRRRRRQLPARPGGRGRGRRRQQRPWPAATWTATARWTCSSPATAPPTCCSMNVIATDNHWFAVRLHGTAGSNPAAIGARVAVTGGGVTQMRAVTGGGGYLGHGRRPGALRPGRGDPSSTSCASPGPTASVQTAGPLTADQLLDVT